MSAFVTISPLNALEKTLMKISHLINVVPKEVMDELAMDMIKRIKARVRTGYGCSSSGGRKEKFAPLAASTIKNRQYAKKRGELVGFTTVSKSHLTRTGKMLDALTYRQDNKGVTILFSRDAEAEKAKHVSVKRPFFFLTSSELKAAAKLIEDSVSDAAAT
jgi:hypothetical protein